MDANGPDVILTLTEVQLHEVGFNRLFEQNK